MVRVGLPYQAKNIAQYIIYKNRMWIKYLIFSAVGINRLRDCQSPRICYDPQDWDDLMMYVGFSGVSMASSKNNMGSDDLTDGEDLVDGVMTFEHTSEGVHIAVQSYFLDEQSRPEESLYVWAYRVKVTNDLDEPVQLINRHWIITDGHGETQEVKGVGVVGEQPMLGPGDSFVYTSGTPLYAPTGFMHGSYDMRTVTGRMFQADIPAFSLDSPYSNNPIH